MGKTITRTLDTNNLPALSVEERAQLDALDKVDDAAIDYSDVPELGEEWFTKARKERLTVRFDRDVVEWFKAQGKGYQTRMNAVLKAFVEQQTRQP